MADTDLAKLSLQFFDFVELYREQFAMEYCEPILQRQNCRLRIACKFSMMMPLEAKFIKMEDYITDIQLVTVKQILVPFPIK